MNRSLDPLSTDDINIASLTAARLSDWLQFFDHHAFADHPEWAFCYCRSLHADTSVKKWAHHTAAENRRAVIPLIRQGGLQGLLAYAGANVVGWCHAAPTRLIPALDDEPGASDEGVGNVVCFVVAPAWRRRGVARLLLDHACDSLRQQGLTVVQAYPARQADTPGGMHFGPLKLYLDTGFTVWRDVPDDPSVTVRKSL
jgi:GNAT superfamily N-acetyltransferase